MGKTNSTGAGIDRRNSRICFDHLPCLTTNRPDSLYYLALFRAATKKTQQRCWLIFRQKQLRRVDRRRAATSAGKHVLVISSFCGETTLCWAVRNASWRRNCFTTTTRMNSPLSPCPLHFLRINCASRFCSTVCYAALKLSRGLPSRLRLPIPIILLFLDPDVATHLMKRTLRRY